MDTKHTLHMRHDKDGNVRPEAIGSHTPGPWKAVPCNEAGNINDIVNADGYRAAGTFGRTKDEQEANARLIAAAPELLAALEDAEFLLRKIGNNPREVAAMVDSFKRSAEDARAAIAKATGQQ